MTTSHAIPVPSNFPVTWPRPEDARLHWRKMGAGRIPPMMVELNRREFEAFARGYALSGRPEVPPRILAANGWLYKHTVPSDPAALAAWENNLPAELERALTRPLGHWRERLLPPVEQLLGRLSGADLAAVTVEELSRRFAAALELDDLVEMLIQPISLLKTVLTQHRAMHAELVGDEPAWEPLVQPAESLPREMQREIENLAQWARTAPGLLEALAEPNAWNGLNGLPADTRQEFEQRLQAFLAAHGRRHDGRDLMAPTWSEDPTPVLRRIREAADQPQALAAVDPDQLMVQVDQRLAAHSPGVQREYLALLERAREASLVREEYQELMQHRVRVHIREILLEFGRRLAAGGELTSPQEIWWLTPEELLAPAPGLRERVAARLAEWELFATVEPPAELGAKPPAIR